MIDLPPIVDLFPTFAKAADKKGQEEVERGNHAAADRMFRQADAWDELLCGVGEGVRG